MAQSAVGVIFTNMHGDRVPELVRRRTMASVPFGGRYRLIDFTLSNMVNSNITTIGLMTHNNYRSLIDHIGSGKDWDLARKDGGIILLPPYSDENEKPYSTRLEALTGLTGFLRHRREKYVVISDSDAVGRLDFSEIIEFHEKKNADITMVTHRESLESGVGTVFITEKQDDRVTGVKLNPPIREKTETEVYVNVAVFNRQFLLDLVEDAKAYGYTSFESDVIAKQLDGLKIYSYEFKGYYAVIRSMESYFKHNMELLDKDVRHALFGARDIYTKVRDSAPSKYGENAVVQNSLISDGCEIEGKVENSILFRGVKVAKGAVVKNCILMQDCIVGNDANINCVITDKNVVITSRRTLCGHEKLPYHIQKGTKL